VSTRSKVSLELVGEFFKVRTQVDRDLTTFSQVDRRLGLIKNLGRHTSGVKCGPHGSKNNKMKLVDGFLVEPQNQGRTGTSWEPSHEW
jgi:hypothetical protein